jgi:cbb3-type cytochrome oxidase maturation protein
MDILYLLIPLSLALVFLIGAVFWWALQSGQFDDLDVPGHAILLDGEEIFTTGDTGNAVRAGKRELGIAKREKDNANRLRP